ncbi:MAG: hypothetical protein IH987_12460 [Planctomycetes bacterium]|nr:hypothetical protein [Planctomycetota bacterium]
MNARKSIVNVMCSASAWIAMWLLVVATGCVSSGSAGRAQKTAPSWKTDGVIRHVRCLYERRPWLNLDAAGDRDPEGIRYRVFLDAGDAHGVHRDGMFHIEMYMIGRDDRGEATRTLVSDWHYPTSKVHTIAKPGQLGDGYFLYLRWARKDIPGHEIEIITQFKDEYGNTARSGTKRIPVPKYAS